MKWSTQQDAALLDIDRWLCDPHGPQVYRLFGYAGTGKTTLAKHIAMSSGGNTLFAAFTGKAALVMRKKGCLGASTLHSLLYRPINKSETKIQDLKKQKKELLAKGVAPDDPRVRDLSKEIAVENENLKLPAFELNPESPIGTSSLLIIDECSMVNESLAKDILSFGTRVLVIGDPAQLPPVGDDDGYFSKMPGRPETLLEEIHRQARENPVIQLATQVRNGKHLKYGNYGESKVVRANTKPDYNEFDQFIVGKNATRFKYSRKMRKKLGHTIDPVEKGERLICCKNHHELGLLNGAFWEVKEVHEIEDKYLELSLKPLDEDKEDVKVQCLKAQFESQQAVKDTPHNDYRRYHHFTYGYAITAHKAQGSEWNNVAVRDESNTFKHNAEKWLYTAITRAAERVTVVR